MIVGEKMSRKDCNTEILKRLDKENKGLLRRSFAQVLVDLGLIKIDDAVNLDSTISFENDFKVIEEFFTEFYDQRFFQGLINLGYLKDVGFYWFEESSEVLKLLNEYDNK